MSKSESALDFGNARLNFLRLGRMGILKTPNSSVC